MESSLYSTAQPQTPTEDLLKEEQIRDIGEFFKLFENKEKNCFLRNNKEFRIPQFLNVRLIRKS